ncbi:MAG: thioredoxin family protein [Candidatus Eisenbacteria sp.]|nr:thioredoxin family protein [Candidatus Eisenbacteria bacterium]
MSREWIAPWIALVIAGLFVTALGAGCGEGDRKDGRAGEPGGQVGAATTLPLLQVLESRLPKVLDFGRGQCVPCKKMAPILNELAVEYDGRAVIRIIDIGEAEGREFSKPFKIQLIPTQIFLDGEGNEVWRHAGFLPREDIVTKLAGMGVKGK